MIWPERKMPTWGAKSGSTGLFDMVELKIARSPAARRIRKGEKFMAVCLLSSCPLTGNNNIRY
ncbi:MAG: hypothetical protein HY885_07355 [Deltaproteobacteria bacterium]|nr:hypothetical protein [Deltaproteobacteria bacterium]